MGQNFGLSKPFLLTTIQKLFKTEFDSFVVQTSAGTHVKAAYYGPCQSIYCILQAFSHLKCSETSYEQDTFTDKYNHGAS